MSSGLCPCQPVPGCEILRTVHPLPKPLTSLNNHLIQSVTSIDGSIIFSEIQWNEVKYKYASKYTSHKSDYFISDGYLFIVGLTQRMRHLKMIVVTGLFEDPAEAANFPSFCETGEDERECFSPLDMEFAVSGEFIDWIISEAAEELVAFFGKQREDLTADSKDNIAEEESK